MNIPENLKYTAHHIWADIKGDIATIGISDFAQSQLGEILFIEMPEVGDEITKDEEFGVAESSKTASDLIAPFDAEVLEINTALEDEPEAVNEDPYTNWILKLKLTDESQISELLDFEAYNKSLDQ